MGLDFKKSDNQLQATTITSDMNNTDIEIVEQYDIVSRQTANE